MKVILNDHIENLGERGDSVVVKPGYARNYLLPKGLAYLDTPGNRKLFLQEQSRWEEMDLHRKSAAEKMAAEMEGTELTFERRAGEKDVLFGSVSVVDIARGLADRGFDLERRRVRMDSPIKELGTFPVEIQVHRDISVTVPVHVIRPGGQPEARTDAAEVAESLEPVASDEEPLEPGIPGLTTPVGSEPTEEPVDPDPAAG
jgi:large subunit ribosomal protein L9